MFPPLKGLSASPTFWRGTSNVKPFMYSFVSPFFIIFIIDWA